MSLLFGGHEFLCDGCGDVIPVTHRDRHTDHPIVGFVRDPGVVVIELCANPGCLKGPKLARHFCPKCATVAADAFRTAFPRIGVVLSICEREDGDPLPPPPPPKDPRERTVSGSGRLWGRCPVCKGSIRRVAFCTHGKAMCSAECADKVESAEREREEFLAAVKGGAA